MTERTAAWQTRPEAGTVSGIRFLMWVARHLGRGFLHTLLVPVSAYFFLVRAPEREASRAFLSRVLQRPATRREVFRHIHGFARTTADRFFFLAGREADIPVSFVIDPKLEQVLASGQTGIFLAAHFGSFEAARVLGPEIGGIRLRIVLDKGLNRRFMDVLSEVEPDLARLIIDSEQDSVALGLNIGDALKTGDWVGFLADRHRNGDRTMTHQFLGAQAQFPTGPYIIANLFKAPIIGAFCHLTEHGYVVHCEVISEGVRFDRKEREAQLTALQAQYVARLEHHVRQSPFSWFNFYDFWAE